MYRILPRHTPDEAALIRAHHDVADEKQQACYKYGWDHPITKALDRWQSDMRGLMVNSNIVKF